jgi:hypothetical protein
MKPRHALPVTKGIIALNLIMPLWVWRDNLAHFAPLLFQRKDKPAFCLPV